MNNPTDFLARHAGRYAGAGVVHETRHFTGVLVIDPPLNPANISYRFTATATDGKLLHTEIACLGRNGAGVIEIVHINNNISGLQHFRLAACDDRGLVMHHGDLDDPHAFREIVRLAFTCANNARLTYDWARPGETMAPQSWVDLTKGTA